MREHSPPGRGRAPDAALPAARAVVNPKRLPADHPLATLPGVGVAWKLAEALQPALAAQHLDLAALGIVADVAVQTGDTRALLQRGLRQLRTSPRLGIQALLRLAEVTPAQLNEDHISFELAPRLNALGRLGDANLAVTLLSSEDAEQTAVLAALLEGLNGERKRLTEQIFQGALAQIEQDPALLEHAALVLANAQWHAGVIGIVASRLVERFQRPVVLLAAPPRELARGSARSTAGCNISKAIATQHALLEQFGGHPMAAGLRIQRERIPEFRRGLARAVAAQLAPAASRPALVVDAVLPLAELTFDLAAELERIGPFGPGNPRLVLASQNHAVLNARTIGRYEEHRSLHVQDAAGHTRQVLWWQGASLPLPAGRFDLAYHARAGNYRGQPQVQVEWVAAQPCADTPATAEPARPALLDYRQASASEAALAALLASAAMEVWREGAAHRTIAGHTRTELAPADRLVIWTAPPSRAVLQAALAQVQPHTVVLFAVDAGMDYAEAFLPRLAGLVKFTLAHGGQTTLARLAAASAQSNDAVLAGLRWLAARADVQLELQVGDSLWLSAGVGMADPAAAAAALSELRALLAESAAYRRYLAQAAAEVVLD